MKSPSPKPGHCREAAGSRGSKVIREDSDQRGLKGGDGEIEEERRAFADGALEGDLAAVALHDLPHDEQAQPRPLLRILLNQ